LAYVLLRYVDTYKTKCIIFAHTKLKL